MIVTKSYPTPRGNTVQLDIRLDTVDEPMVYGSIVEDEYGIKDMNLQPGDFFLDVGAYIGSVGLAVAADYPETMVMMVEAVPENVDSINRSVMANGWSTFRVFALNRAATSALGVSEVFYGSPTNGSSHQFTNRYVGGLEGWRKDFDRHALVPNISLSVIVAEHGPIAVMKIDCEGCEYSFLDDDAITQVDRIIGEFHGGFEPLEATLWTHKVTLISTNPDDANFGIFSAVRG
jgi:FkbM family methyltransferase